MHLTLCQVTFHENLFYATREAGRLYETGRYLHNYALTYALGLAQAPYFHAEQIPSYAQELAPLNARGIYVTPARGIDVRYELVTFKYADNAYRVKMKPGTRNTPSYGRAKEIAVGSRFEFAVVSREPVALPTWIRMGLWRSKARVTSIHAEQVKQVGVREEVAGLPLNPLDVGGRLRVYDLISMPPSSLVENARIDTSWLVADFGKRQLALPDGMQYTFASG